MAAQENDDDDEYQQLVKSQRLKAAVHYTVGLIAVEAEQETGLKFNRHLIAAISESTCKYTQTMARDLELFAKHAKRSTINTDDILMVVRKTKTLSDYMREYTKELTDEKEKINVKRKEKKKKSTTTSVAATKDVDSRDDWEESNQ